MEQKEETADGGARAPDIPQIGQSCDTPATSAGKRRSDDMSAPKRLKRATEATASAHTASAMPGDSAEGPSPTSPDTNAQQALPEASLPASLPPPMPATTIPVSAALSHAVGALALDNQRLALESERLVALAARQHEHQEEMLGNAAAENRALRAQVDALQAGQAEATQGYLSEISTLRSSVEELETFQERLRPYVPPEETCSRFRHGRCTKGRWCPRLHVVPPCRFFDYLSGCSRGEACKFAHVALQRKPVRLVPAKH